MNSQLTDAVAALKKGGVIAYPTEAVFGLGCDPQNPAALQQLLAIKQRPAEKGLILVAADEHQLDGFVDFSALPAERLREVRASWPGPNTWLIPVGPKAIPLLSGQFATLAVRISAHPVVRDLCEAFGGPITSTSANLTGQPPLCAADEFDAQPELKGQLAALVAGKVDRNARPSVIRDALSGRVIRA